jgi:DHA1 family multidrug resistance protein-like MFS transporter
MWLTVLLAGYWFIWAQINLTVPLAAARFGGVRLAALVLALNAGLSIVLQYPLNSLVSRWCSHRTVLALCTALSAAGMALVFVSPLVSLLVLGVIVFALGRMIVSPVINVITAELAPAGKLGAYFGFGALSIGVGAGGGQIIGGVLYDAAQRYHQPALLWGSMLLVGTLVSLGLSRLRLPDRTSQPGSGVLAPRTDS